MALTPVPMARPLAGPDALYRLLVENVTDYAIILLGTDGRIATWTEGAGRMFGYAEEEALGGHFSRFYPPEEAEEGVPDRDLHAVLRDGRCETVAWRVRRDGSRLWATVVLTAIHDRGGRPIGVGQITRDLTERKEVAERYEESRQRYRSLFENNPDAVCSLDLDGTLRAANPAAEALTGYDGGDLLATPFWSLLAPAHRAPVRTAFERAAAGTPQQAEGALVHRGGGRVDVRLTLVPIEVRGEVLGVYCIAQDIRERLRGAAERESLLLRERIARAEAEAANQAKSDFLAVVSHELRTPLNAILNFSEILLDGDAGSLDAGQRRSLERVHANAGQLRAIIEDVLGYTRLDSGGDGVRVGPAEVRALAERVLAEARPSAERRGLTLALVDGGEVWAMTDPERVRELLRALLSNAVKFTESGGVEVSVGTEAGWVAVRVADTGIGIREADAERIWEPFWQAESPLTRRIGGTGLGLSIVRRLAALLGGDVEAASTPGVGSVFTVRLPAAAGTA